MEGRSSATDKNNYNLVRLKSHTPTEHRYKTFLADSLYIWQMCHWMTKDQNCFGYHGFLRADAAPMTTARMIPRPAPREAPTAALVKEDAFA